MGDGRTSIRGGFGMFYGSITGNEWNTTADNQPFTVRQCSRRFSRSSDPYRNLPGGVGPFPFVYSPDVARFTFPAQVFGPALDFVWPVTYQTNVTVQKEIGRGHERERVVRRRVRAASRRAGRSQLSDHDADRDRGERQRAASVPAGDDRRGQRARVDLRQRLQRHCS